MRFFRLISAIFLSVLAAPGWALTPAEIASLDGPDRQAQLEAGARREGTVSLYTALIVDQAVRPLAAAFAGKYPYLKLDYWRGESRQIVQKVLAERRAGTPQADVIEGTGLADSLVAADAVAHFTSPELAAFDPAYRDPQGFWAPLRFDYYGAAFNTKQVAPGEAPRSYDSLLDARWRGKIAWLADNETGALLLVTTLRLAWGEERARDFMAGFAAQAPISVTASARTLVNRVIEGEYPIALNVALHHPLISAGQGAPVAPAAMNPVTALVSIVMLGRDIKHPYAAMLLIDFLLSHDGQAVMRDNRYLTARGDVPPLDEMAPIVPKRQGLTEQFIRPEALSREHDKSEALFERYFP
jgi:iron(III) transport system substrate-binding protein